MSNRERRRFSSDERVALYVAAGGVCECQGCPACGPDPCGQELEPGWHADHVHPWSKNGVTDVVNGQALCPSCNREKGSKMGGSWPGGPLREWQQQALDVYQRKNSRDFLTVATPGAGKTTFALRVAHQLVTTGHIDRIIVVVPTEHLKEQWAQSAHRFGIELDPTTKNRDGLENHKIYQGAALTYAQVSMHPDLHRTGVGRRRTLVIFDEIHHAGDDKAWGTGIMEAFDLATRRLALSGTPFRSDSNPIPFVTYESGTDKVQRSVADFTYGYGRAIRDGVCRQVDFHFYDGEMRWNDSGSCDADKIARLSADLSDDDRSDVLATALDPDMPWMKNVLAIADQALSDIRLDAPNAGGLVIAYRTGAAREYARILKEITGEPPVLVVSEDGPEASTRITHFDKSSARWLIAVRMVSEGVDVPRLAVGVYATKTGTPMFFRQAVGRFVRRQPDEEHSAMVFCPALSTLRTMAAEIETEIRDEIEEEREEYEKAKRTSEQVQMSLDLFERTSIATSDPEFDSAIHGGEEYTPEENAKAEELCKEFGFGLSALPKMRKLVRARLSDQAAPATTTGQALTPGADLPVYKHRERLARQLDSLVRRYAVSRHHDFPQVNWKVNEHMGVSTRKNATIDQLERGIEFMKRLSMQS